MATPMKPTATILLLAITLAPFVGSASADPCFIAGCHEMERIVWCVLTFHITTDCIPSTDSACISFHVGAMTTTMPSTTRRITQFPGFGMEFVFPPTIDELHTDKVGLGTFTIDLDTGARSC